MTTHPVEMRELRVPLSDIERLTVEERFAYYLLGHMFNELLSLQKLIAFALPKHDDVRPARVEPEMGQALLLFRIACGKIWEARLKINSKEVAQTLNTHVWPKMPDGNQRLKEVNAAISGAQWISRMRNTIGFHYPEFEAWQPLMQLDATWVPDSVYLGAMTGNTFYAGSDAIAQAWMFGLYGDQDPRDAVDPLMGAMIDLLRLMTNFLEQVLGVFITESVLTSPSAPPKIGEISAPEFEQVALPFWTSMPAGA